MPERKPIVHLWDLDDTLLERGKLARFGGLTMHLGRTYIESFRGYYHPPTVRLEDIVPSYHGSVPGSLKPQEIPNFIIHSRRTLVPGSREALQETGRSGVNVVNSGRSSREPWVHMTDKTLERENIYGFIEGVRFKPSGMSSALSKVDVARSYQLEGYEVRMYDDDPRTALVEAELLSDAHVFLIWHAITGLIAEKGRLRMLPNVQIVRSVYEAATAKKE